MRIRQAGKVAEHLWYLGRKESGVYLLEGKNDWVMINGGITFILPDVLRQMKEFGIDPGKIGKIVILHSHFDHVGVVPYFKRTWPHIEVCASRRSWEILNMPKAVETANAFSRLVAREMKADEALVKYDLDWRDDISGTALAGGDRIELGNRSLTILDTPGHSSCSISAYEPGMKALFPSDAVGIPYDRTAFPSGNSDYTQYQKSLELLKPLPVSYLCADHYGFVTGEEAAGFVDLTIGEARKMRSEMETVYREKKDLDASARAMTALFYERSPDYFLSAEILEGVFKQMVKHIAKNL